jgi:hypothetical protein
MEQELLTLPDSVVSLLAAILYQGIIGTTSPGILQLNLENASVLTF